MGSIKQPKDTALTVKSAEGTVEAFLNFDKTLATRLNAGYDRAQKFLDSEVIRLSEPMVPMQTATLRRSGMAATRIGSGLVRYNTPYARYQYYGKVMVGRAPKIVTDRPLTYQVGQAKWFEQMKASNGKDLLKKVLRYVIQ